jgi:minor histocompatibility antigen H13
MAEQPNYLGLGLVALMLVVPQLTLIHPYLHLLIVAPLLVWIGCEGALAEQQKAPEESQVETVSRKDAMRFPFIGSAVLFGLYIVVKLVKKEYLDLLISIYFAALGAISIFECARPALTGALGMGSLHRYQFSFHWQRWKRREDAEPLAFSYSVFDVAVFALCAAGSVAYAVTKKWYLNNLLGCAFSIQGIQMLALGSWAIGFILLWGLFVYDVFWVFGTEVMVSVAKGLNAPVKILFPKALGVKPVPCSMLGLGDIVIPGIFVALMLSMDVRKGLASRPYFISNLIAYELGLAMTVGVMHFFDAAQPALLYLVPMCIGASLLMGLARGEVKEVINFSRERKEEEKVEKSD